MTDDKLGEIRKARSAIYRDIVEDGPTKTARLVERSKSQEMKKNAMARRSPEQRKAQGQAAARARWDK